jgi:hypothetical protein
LPSYPGVLRLAIRAEGSPSWRRRGASSGDIRWGA